MPGAQVSGDALGLGVGLPVGETVGEALPVAVALGVPLGEPLSVPLGEAEREEELVPDKVAVPEGEEPLEKEGVGDVEGEAPEEREAVGDMVLLPLHELEDVNVCDGVPLAVTEGVGDAEGVGVPCRRRPPASRPLSRSHAGAQGTTSAAARKLPHGETHMQRRAMRRKRGAGAVHTMPPPTVFQVETRSDFESPAPGRAGVQSSTPPTPMPSSDAVAGPKAVTSGGGDGGPPGGAPGVLDSFYTSK